MGLFSKKSSAADKVNELEAINERFSQSAQDVKVSFEFFPPNSEEMNKTLWSSIQKLEPLSPDFVSVTYGAGASTRDRTHKVIRRIQKETSLNPVPHLTCINSSQQEIEDIAESYWEQGVRHIVALRGDIDESSNIGDFKYASDLIVKLKKLHDFEITVAAYPEVHPEAESAKFDLDNLKRKIDSGATRAISQFFFSSEKFLRFRDACAAENINIDITPGILPVTNFNQLLKFSKFTNVNIPEWMHSLYHGLDEDADTRKLIASHLAIEQVKILNKEGVDSFHFYTLNRADLTYAICHTLGKRKQIKL